MIENAQQVLAQAETVKNFLNDPTIAAMFKALEARNYDAFVKADTDATRLQAWAQARVLAEFGASAIAVMDAGHRIRAETLADEKRTSAPDAH